ncbi:MAG: DnaJ domain-containing protein [Alphaproteobacteria bacterium]|jgi:DnaJ like chaperone protein|nr:DnaJ domain-containing protein [Alphaproteobacteria bacterium]
MSIWGKLIGGAAGFAIGGPIGLMVGVAAGHIADNVGSGGRSRRRRLPRSAKSKQQIFAIALIVLAAKMAKADGQVTRDEVDAFKRLFKVPQEDMKAVGRIFNKSASDADGFEPYAKQVAEVFAEHQDVLEEFLGALMHIALADGHVHPEERRFLREVADIFGFDDEHFERVTAQHGASEADDPYGILGISMNATDDEVKSAYRALVRANHPDHLIAEGVPEEVVNLATEKLATINDAYARIERQRGL